jgi:hypothetical protein
VNERQQEMESMSLINPSALNLFTGNILKFANSKEVYTNPPLKALNNTKKLFEQ